MDLLQGFHAALLPMNIFYVIMGGFLGTVVGMLPGLGPSAGVAVLIPLTFGMNPASALILMSSVYYGAMYGGSRSSILLNTPGDAAAIASCFDGYPLAKKGMGGQALAISAIASLIGGMIATVGFIFFIRPLANFALDFGSAEYFLLYLFAILTITALAKGSMVRGIISMTIGLFISTIGIDIQTSVYRFTFGIPNFYNGLDFVVIVIGIYAIGEVLYNFLTIDVTKAVKGAEVGRVWINKDEWRRSRAPIFRGGLLGFIVGVLPAGGATIASMMSYSMEKQLSKHPEEFGKGAIEGLAAPEAANNAASVGGLIPLLAMGIPGTATTAVMMGAFVMIGLKPGPLLFQQNQGMVATLVDSMFIGNAFLVILNLVLVKLLVKVLDIPSGILYPIILALSFVGAYTLNFSTVDFYLLVLFGVVGLFMKLLQYPIAPMILPLVVGKDMEQNFRRTVSGDHGNIGAFFDSPISIALVVMIVATLLSPLITGWIGKRRKVTKS
ncbi:MAG TPA: tripartite tricarboxylate transporter permease [Rectinemataceae bacterium]|nr:tripartite tricarboxylate transporter permease [Rectinemataceae bacterium]